MRIVEIAVIILIVLAFGLLITVAFSYIAPGTLIRPLGEFYLYATYNPYDPIVRLFTAMSPESVTAIVWDFRGLDTLFETSVFYLAIIGALALTRGLMPAPKGEEGQGLSVIVKSVTKITVPMILAVGASVGLHGHLTPGGGFQGGSVIAVIPMLMIVIFSVLFLAKRMNITGFLILRSIGLAIIGFTGVALFIAGLVQGVPAWVFQNMPKPGAPLSMPVEVHGALISGTLWFFNLAEMIAVASGFSIAFLILLLVKEVEFRGES